MRSRRKWSILVGIVSLVVSTTSASSGCPSPEELAVTLDELQLERASRTQRFGNAVPVDLYMSAARHPGQPAIKRSGLRGFGVALAKMPVEQLWAAVNDKEHFDLEEDFIPVQISQVIEGDPRRGDRLLFQMFKRWGVGRWWVSRIRTNEDLYRESEGKLWELYWRDETASADTDRAPVADVAADIPPLEYSEGSWLMIPLTENCTAVEYFTYSKPGGIVQLGQMFLAKRGVVLTLEGLLNMAERHVSEHDMGEFIRPDGTPLGL